MNREPIIKYIKQIGRPVFTTREIYSISGKSLSGVVQGLNHLSKLGVIVKIRRGVWAEPSTYPPLRKQVISRLEEIRKLNPKNAK